MKKSFAGLVFLFVFALVSVVFKGKASGNGGFYSAGIAESTSRSPRLDSFIVILGRWKIARIVYGEASAVPDDKAIKELYGKAMVFNWRVAVMLNDTCITPVYESRRWRKLDYFTKILGQHGDLDIPINRDSITVARLWCRGRTVHRASVINDYVYSFIVIDDNTLLTPYHGFYLLLNRDTEKSKPVAIKKPEAAKVAVVNKPTESKPSINGLFNVKDDPTDPFHVFAALVNSAVKLTEKK